MNQNIFYIYDNVYKNNKYLYKYLWSIKSNQERINYIVDHFEQIDNCILCNNYIDNWRVGMPKYKKKYYISCYFNYYNYNMYIYIHSSPKNITNYNIKDHFIINNNKNQLLLINNLAKYNSDYYSTIHLKFNKKRNFIMYYLIFLLNHKNIPKDIIISIIQYLY